MQLQGKLQELKKQLAASYADLEWFSGKMKMRINGNQEIIRLEIEPSLFSDIDLNNKLLRCINEAIQKSQSLAAKAAKEITGFTFPGL